MSDLKGKSVSGVIWVTIEKFSTTGVKFALGILMARLLSPSDFGLIGMISIFFIMAEVFVEGGFGLAYVQKKEINENDADTVFYTNLVTSLFFFTILFFAAPLIANFYGQQELVLLTRVMSVIIIINAFNIVQRAQITRDLGFKKLTKITIISSLLSGGLGVGSAWWGLGVWALVIQTVSSRIFVTLGFWFVSNYRPKWRFSKQSFSEMFSFGSWLLFSNIVRSLFDNIYLLIIGKFFPLAQLGFYSKARQLSKMSTTNIAVAVGSVAFPVYSNLQNDNEKLRNAMQKFIRHTMFFMAPLLAALIVLAEPLILLLLTEKWLPMVPFFQIICAAGLLYPLNQIFAQALNAIGKSNLSFYLEISRNLLRLLNIFFTYKLGVASMLIGEAIISLIFFFINGWFINTHTNYAISKQIADIWRVLFGACIAALACIFVNAYIDNLIIQLILGFFVIGSSYLFIEYLIDRALVISIWNIMKNKIFK